MNVNQKYCVDTSAFIHAWRRSYPIENFPKFWEFIDNLISNKRLLASKEVYAELAKRDDELLEWAKSRMDMFVDIEGDEIQKVVSDILGNYPRLVDTRKNRSAADPFVIALASMYDPPLVVVSQEGASNNIEKPNIPDVCAAMRLRCIQLLDLIKDENWTF